MRRVRFKGFMATLPILASIAVIGAASLIHATPAAALCISIQGGGCSTEGPGAPPDTGDLEDLRAPDDAGSITLSSSQVVALDDGVSVIVRADGDITIFAPHGLIATDIDTSMVGGTIRMVGSAPPESPGFCSLCPTGRSVEFDVAGAITLIAAFPLGDVKFSTPGDLTIFFRPFDDGDDDLAPVPEPSTALLFGLGLAALLGTAGGRHQAEPAAFSRR